MTETGWVLDVARYSHILAVATGFGAAFLADHMMLSRLRRPIDAGTLAVLSSCHAVIWKALVVMWITGILLIGMRTGFDPANLTPKLIAKVGVVALLTLNAVVIGRVAMPLIRATEGRSLLWLPPTCRATLAVVGAVSSASWLLAMAMGSSKVLATAPGTLFGVLLPACYGLAITLALGVLFRDELAGFLPRRTTLRLDHTARVLPAE